MELEGSSCLGAAGSSADLPFGGGGGGGGRMLEHVDVEETVPPRRGLSVEVAGLLGGGCGGGWCWNMSGNTLVHSHLTSLTSTQQHLSSANESEMQFVWGCDRLGATLAHPCRGLSGAAHGDTHTRTAHDVPRVAADVDWL